ncbi:LOW QUALITY PROTEIN: isoleucine--tRNA ligase, cytoplasmic-like [Argopecten irradians]|uniref:LOW QUALITY PROTEIN: isoleucine--tRNA ligase, cytoplasmic-like n=1 Tax=Argopecten irradians TaxID=31199 RepID=UPI003718277E
MSMSKCQPVAEHINFPKMEESVLKHWKDIDAFKTSLKQSAKKPRYTFYDGPPFATGLPHYGHILAGTIKDVVTRYAHQTGYHVERRFGWDCHGLPVEYEIDKTLGITGPEDVMKMGIEKYNAECRKIVMRYSQDWQDIVTRLGRWIDFENDYKTMYPWFMESIWFVFKELYKKGFVYKGAKVMPYSTMCNTPLSNFESGQNYKDVIDPAVIVSFPLVESPEVNVLAWTTTPWTLPSNISLCVNANMDYIKVKDSATNNIYILMEARLQALYKSEEEYTVLEKFKGKAIVGKKYQPLFNYFEYMGKEKGAFRILCDDYVSAESGTGIVHQAPYFGEDDYRVCLANGIISKDSAMICPVDASGRFTDEVVDFKGMHVKDADKHIMKTLKANKRLVHQGTITHSYPFCWRSETPLIYKAVPSWFVRVEQATQRLLNNNSKTYWVPDFVKEKRFANWLRDARDWAISRNRYWGTPIPLWISDDGEEVVCVGSIEELHQLSGVKVDDLHRETVDKITIPSKFGKGQLKRTPEVFDCWFESGSMPYAQVHYPFERKKDFDDNFPADFIAEGVDQTRGWFYTLLVLSTLLFDKPPFKNLIVNGLVLAADKQKMSKRKKNYPDPIEVVNKYGADALRLYLCNSPAVRAENLCFREEGVERVLKDVFLPWYNAYRFFMQNAERYEREEGGVFLYNPNNITRPTNYMDRWMLSSTQSLLKFVKKEMSEYHLYTVMPVMVKFVGQLTNWYVRMNRKRLKGDGGAADCRMALETLFGVLHSMIRVMSPLIPFITEHMYQNLQHLLDPAYTDKLDIRSVHFLMIPDPREDLIDTQMETAVSRMQSVIEIGRLIRDRNTLPMKYPLKEVVAINGDEEALHDISFLSEYIKEELNVKNITTTSNKNKYGAQLVAEPDFKSLAGKLKGDVKKIYGAIKSLRNAQLENFQETGQITVEGNVLEEGDMRLRYKFDAKDSSTPNCYDAHGNKDVLVLLDVTPDQSMLDEGIAREVINRMQRLRKKGGIVPSDDITVYYQASDSLTAIINNFSDFIFSTIKQPVCPYPVPAGSKVVVEESTSVKKDELMLTIVSRSGDRPKSMAVPTVQPAAVVKGVTPTCSYINVQLCGLAPQEGVSGNHATVLLENPKGKAMGSRQVLVDQVKSVFGVRGIKLEVYKDSNMSEVLPANVNVTSLAGKTLYVAAKCQTGSAPASSPMCHFANVEMNGVKGTLLLENPKGVTLSVDQLRSQVSAVFGLDGQKIELSSTKDGKKKLTNENCKDSLSLHSSTVYAVKL